MAAHASAGSTGVPPARAGSTIPSLNPAAHPHRLAPWAVYLALVLGTLAVYWPVRHYEFIRFDDDIYVIENPWLRAGWSGVAWAFTTGQAANWHPLTWLSHLLDVAAFGMNAGAHHMVSLAFHLANALLLLTVLRRLTGVLPASGIVAALFAWHPLHVESVVWISERKDLLCGLFWILSMGAYVRYAERPRLRRYVVVLILLACGLMAKPMIVTLPFVFLLLDYWPLGRWQRPVPGPAGARNAGAVARGLLLEKVPLLALAAASSWVTYLVQLRGGAMHSAELVPLPLRISNAVVAYVRYLAKTFWPSDLAVLYPWPAGGWPAIGVAGSVALLGAITVLAFTGRMRRPAVLVGWLWFLGTLVPVIGLVQIGRQSLADRYTYLPHIGLFVALVWGSADVRHRPRRLAAAVTALAALSAFLLLTPLQLRRWRDTGALFTHTLAVTTNNYVAHHALAYFLTLRGEFESAREHVERAIAIDPNFLEAHFQLGVILEQQKNVDAASAAYGRALALRPDWPEPRKRLANLLAAENRSAAAIAQYETLLSYEPLDVDARFRLAGLLSQQQRIPEAIQQYEVLARARPELPEALNNLAVIFATQPSASFRNGSEAIRLAERACALAGRRNAVFLGTLAAAYAEAGRFGDAVKTAEEAVGVAQSEGDNVLAGANRRLLELFRAGKPARMR